MVFANPPDETSRHPRAVHTCPSPLQLLHPLGFPIESQTLEPPPPLAAFPPGLLLVAPTGIQAPDRAS